MPQGPNVVFVTRKWAPAIGGMETYSMRLTEKLGEMLPLEVVALPGRADGRPPSALALLMFPFTFLTRWFRLRHRTDVLHLGDMALWPLGLLAGGKTRVVLSAHGTDVAYQRRGGFKGSLYRFYLALGSRMLGKAKVVANSRATASVAAETGWRNSCVVPLATDLAAFNASGDHDGKLLFVGRLVERKGCGWFIREVLPLLPQGIGLRVAGTGWHDSEQKALADPRVEWLGPLHGQALIDAYGTALCVVVPNIELANGEYEGFGLVAPEAAASGGVVLASACGGLTDAVIDGTTGMLVAPGDAGAWAAKILEIAGWARQDRRRFTENAIKTAQAHFAWDRVARETLAAY